MILTLPYPKQIDAKKVLKKKRREREKKAGHDATTVSSAAPLAGIITAVTVGAVNPIATNTIAMPEVVVQIEQEAQQNFSEDRKMINSFALFAKLEAYKSHLEAKSFMEEAVKAEKEARKAFKEMQQSRIDEWQKERARQKAWAKKVRAKKAAKEAQRKAEAARRKAEAEARAAEEARKQAQKQCFASVAGEEMLLAQIIQQEAGYGRADKIYVGSVILNRVRTNYRDFRSLHSISAVLHQPGQYDSRTLERINRSVSAESLEVAHGLITGEITCLEEKILFQTTTWQSWMAGHVQGVSLSGAEQFYGYPTDFEEKCQ